MFNKFIPIAFALGACTSTPTYQAKNPTERYASAVVSAALSARLSGQRAQPYTNCVMQNASSKEISTISALGVGPASDDLIASIINRPQTTQCIARIEQSPNQPAVSYSEIVTTLGAISSVAAAYNSGQAAPQQQRPQIRQQAALEPVRQTENTIQQPPQSTSANSTDASGSPSANSCINYSGDRNSTAFFKGRIRNSCGRPVSVRWCEVDQCSTAASFYTDLATIPAGSSIPADTEGRGVRYASCFSDASTGYSTAITTNRTTGSFRCR